MLKIRGKEGASRKLNTVRQAWKEMEQLIWGYLKELNEGGNID